LGIPGSAQDFFLLFKGIFSQEANGEKNKGLNTALENMEQKA
jgi:hypothetical protein